MTAPKNSEIDTTFEPGGLLSRFSNRPKINDTKFSNTSLSMDANKLSFEFKVILIGDVYVGKTSILSRFTENKYVKDYKCSVGTEFKVKSINVDENTIANLKVWDTCGDEKFRSVTRQYYRDIDGVILVYDLTKRETFDSLTDWINDISDNSPKNATIFIIGNKSDLRNDRKVQTSEGVAFAKEKGLDYLEVSAKTGNNIYLLFEKLSDVLVKKIKEKEERESQAILDKKKKKKITLLDIGNDATSKKGENGKLIGCCH